jgi:hypothetical protein
VHRLGLGAAMTAVRSTVTAIALAAEP